MEEIFLNIIPTGSHPVCHVSQYDVGRQIKVNLFNGAAAYTLLAGDTLTLNILKPNGENVSVLLDSNTGLTYAYIVTEEIMCDVMGKNVCELRLKNGTKNIGTLNFYIDVEEAIAEVEPIPSNNNFVLFANGKWNEMDDYDLTISETGAENMEIIDGKLHFSDNTGFSIYNKNNKPFLIVISLENMGESNYFYLQSGRCVRGADAKKCMETGTDRYTNYNFTGYYNFDGAVKTHGISEDYADTQALFIAGADFFINQICVFPIINSYTISNTLN